MEVKNNWSDIRYTDVGVTEQSLDIESDNKIYFALLMEDDEWQ